MGGKVKQLTDADVLHQRTATPHIFIDIDTIDKDIVEEQPDAVLLNAQLKWMHHEGFIRGMVRC
jgi:hypothetical protein